MVDVVGDQKEMIVKVTVVWMGVDLGVEGFIGAVRCLERFDVILSTTPPYLGQ